jgi:hypothetical protein
MDQVCFALPILAGKSEAAHTFFGELEGERKSDFAVSEQRVEITKESWHLQQTPQGDLLLAYIESPDFSNALKSFSRSQEEFDEWFKQWLAEVTGVDLNHPPPGALSKQLSSYEST